MRGLTLIAGWALATAPFVDVKSLTTRRWTGVAAVAATVGAALASGAPHIQSDRSLVVYRGALFGAAVLVAIAGHLGAALVWRPDFLKP